MHRLSTGAVDLYEIESIELGGTCELGLIKMKCLTSEDGEEIAVPSNFISSMAKKRIIIIYDPV